MSIFVDTNVLLRSVQPSHPMHDAAVRTVAALIRAEEPFVITPQIVAEFWNLATRPVEHNGLGWTHEEALQEVNRMEEFLSLVAESLDVYGEWKRLVTAHRVTGVQAHDARLVAAIRTLRERHLVRARTAVQLRPPVQYRYAPPRLGRPRRVLAARAHGGTRAFRPAVRSEM